MSKDTQCERLRKLMRRRWLSPADALELAGTMRLAARVFDLRRAGVNVIDRWCTNGDRRWKEYLIV